MSDPLPRPTAREAALEGLSALLATAGTALDGAYLLADALEVLPSLRAELRRLSRLVYEAGERADDLLAQEDDAAPAPPPLKLHGDER